MTFRTSAHSGPTGLVERFFAAGRASKAMATLFLFMMIVRDKLGLWSRLSDETRASGTKYGTRRGRDFTLFEVEIVKYWFAFC